MPDNVLSSNYKVCLNVVSYINSVTSDREIVELSGNLIYFMEIKVKIRKFNWKRSGNFVICVHSKMKFCATLD